MGTQSRWERREQERSEEDVSLSAGLFHMSERAQLRREEAEKADAETVTKIILWALLVQWGHI